MCKDPIWSYICPDCLGTDIMNWLPSYLAKGFAEFHNHFLTHFSINKDPTFENCIKCGSPTEANICPFCYIVEAFHWLREKDENLARSLYKMLPLSHDWRVTHLHGCVWKEGYRALDEVIADKTEQGICDECGGYSDRLALVNGEWICSRCESQ